MDDLTATFETGSNGATIATTDAGSATAWDRVKGTPTYDNSHPAQGSLGALFAADDTYVVWSTTFGTKTEHYGRFYAYMTANPAGVWQLCRAYRSGESTPVASVVNITSAGKIQTGDVDSQLGLSTNTVALDQLVRFEYHIIHSTTVGFIEVKLFNDASSTSPTETITSTSDNNTGADCDGIRFGHDVGGSAGSTWIDAIVAGATSYPGPLPATPTYTVLNGSDEQLSNVNVAGVDVDAASYKNGVALTESELAALLSASFGKNNVAVLPDLTGVADARQIKKTTFSAETESA